MSPLIRDRRTINRTVGCTGRWARAFACLLIVFSHSVAGAKDREVVDILRKLSETTRVELNGELNRKRVDSLRTAIGNAPSWSREVRLRLQVGDLLLRAGRTHESIEEFRYIESELSRRKSTAPLRATWPLHAFLGLAHMRLAEQENCLHLHNPESCLFPISSAGVHVLQESARRALLEYGQVLEQRPEDGAARWLFNINHMTVGSYPHGVPEKWRIDPTVFASEGDIGRFIDVASALDVDALGLSGGSIVEDFDRDGDLDFMASSWGLDHPLRLFTNGSDGTFVQSGTLAGLSDQLGGLNLVHADYDNNGYADVFVLRGAWWNEEGHHPNSLLRNEKGNFVDVTAEVGLLSFHPTQTAAWGDYDNDGFVDLYVGNESNDWERHPCELFNNKGGVRFVDRAQEAGVDNVGYVKGVAWGDYDNDGDIDLFLSRMGQVNALYRNDGEAGFRELSATAGVEKPVWSFPTWFFDYDNDGWLDLFVGGYDNDAIDITAVYLGQTSSASRSMLFRNGSDGRFTAVDSGLEEAVLVMGANYGDLDNDGFVDVYLGTGNPDLRSLLPNRMYRNEGGMRFLDVTSTAGTGHLQKGHGISFGDVDNDGDQDIYQVMGGAYSGDTYYNVLYANPGHGNHWVTLELEGVASSRDAIGARIQVRVRQGDGMRDIWALAGSGGSFGGSSLQQEIGIGQVEKIDFVAVRWPATGEVERFYDISLNGAWLLREGTGKAVSIDRRSFDLMQSADHSTRHH